MKKKIFRRSAIILILVFFLAQFFRPEKNNGAAETATDITHYITVPPDVMAVLKTSCYDCHSNKTNYPWYAEITPANFWLANHVREGKRELNFSDFSVYNRRRIKNKLSSIADQVEKGEMPLASYTLIHRKAVLSDTETKLITLWVDSATAQLNRQ